MSRPKRTEPALSFADWILWSDRSLVAVDKPAGVLSQGGEGGAGKNLVDLARAHFGRANIGVLHRLDRNVSGIVLLSLDSRAAEGLRRAFESGEVRREYIAIVRGSPTEDRFTVEAPLAKDERTNTVRAHADPEHAPRSAKPARTEVVVESRWRAPIGSCAALEVFPITGRSHQIRVHLAHVGLPIIGDPKYGTAARGIHRPLLHARAMSFHHPLTGDSIDLQSAPPWRREDLAVLRR